VAHDPHLSFAPRQLNDLVGTLGLAVAIVAVLLLLRWRPPTPVLLGRRPPDQLRQAVYRGRNVVERALQPAQKLARTRHPLRQTRHRLPRRGRPCLDPALATQTGDRVLAGGSASHSHGSLSTLFTRLWITARRDPVNESSPVQM